jgi:hypothetical protein
VTEEHVMTKNTRRKKPADLQATAAQADGFSWSETQTGTSIRQRESRDPGDDGVEHTVTMLDYEGSPVVTATEATDV